VRALAARGETRRHFLFTKTQSPWLTTFCRPAGCSRRMLGPIGCGARCWAASSRHRHNPTPFGIRAVALRNRLRRRPRAGGILGTLAQPTLPWDVRTSGWLGSALPMVPIGGGPSPVLPTSSADRLRNLGSALTDIFGTSTANARTLQDPSKIGQRGLLEPGAGFGFGGASTGGGQSPFGARGSRAQASSPRQGFLSRRKKINEAECEAQYERDIFQCNMVGLPECYAQANERWSACLAGRPIPPFNY
jgi:hypothetical protein